MTDLAELDQLLAANRDIERLLAACRHRVRTLTAERERNVRRIEASKRELAKWRRPVFG